LLGLLGGNTIIRNVGLSPNYLFLAHFLLSKFSILKVEAVGSSETSIKFGVHGVTPQKVVLFAITQMALLLAVKQFTSPICAHTAFNMRQAVDSK
jgi:hypothetical protein